MTKSMINNDITVFAETTFRNKKIKFGIKTDDRRRHMYLIGKTGMGKSTILENMIVADIRAGRGVAVVDPHGDLAEKVMKFIPADRVNDIIYFNPSDTDFPIAFNIVEHVDVKVRHLVASGLIGVFKKLWVDSWGPRLEYILRNAILAVLDFPDANLLSVIRMLSDKTYRKKVIAEVQDPVVRSFWQKEFASYADKFASEAVSPIQNKVGQFLSSSLIRNIVGQTKSSIDVRKAMDEGKIIIMNLSKGHIGEDNSALLGAMMITKIQLAAMSRVDIPEKERRDFYLYIDEFQNFSTESFASILSEARKYRLNLIIAHQYIEQLTDEVKAAVFGNVGTLVAFRVGAVDAEELVKEFTPTFEEEDILNLPKFEFYVKLMIDGVASSPFSARGLPPLRDDEMTNNAAKAIDNSRRIYAKDVASVEEDIMRTHFADEFQAQNVATAAKIAEAASVKIMSDNVEPVFTPAEPRAVVIPVPAPRVEIKKIEKENISPRPKKEEIKEATFFEAACSNCQATTKVPFKPDGKRPIYCKNCLSELKNKKREGSKIVPEIKNNRPDVSGLSPNTLASRGKLESVEPTAISLAQLSSAGKVDFKGHSKPSENNLPPKKETTPEIKISSGEKDLKEGEDIIFG